MAASSQSQKDAERMTRLRRLGVLDSDPEPLFDALTRAAAQVAETPTALLSLADEDRHWFKSSFGFGSAREAPHENAFCTHAMYSSEIFEVPDTHLDAQFSENVLVRGKPHIRFYAGAPIILDGVNLGSLCVIDTVPKQLSVTQKSSLCELANVAAFALEQRAEASERRATSLQAAELARQLDEDHTRLGHIVQASRAGIWEWDLRTGLAKVDARWGEQLGLTIDELPALNLELWEKNTHREDWERANQTLQAHMRGETSYYDAEFRMRHKEGHWVWIRSQGGIITRDEKGEAVVIAGTHADITDRKAAEREQRDSEQLLDRTGRVAEVGGWQVELATNTVAWTRETCRLHNLPVGYRPTLEEAIAFYPEAASLQVRTVIENAMANGNEWDIEVPFVPRGGKQIWVRVFGMVDYEEGKPARLIGAIQNITSRRRAINAMEVSERRFRRLFEQSTGLIYTHDIEGNILAVNPAAAKALGYSPEEMIGKPLSAFVPFTEHALVDQYLQRLIGVETVADVVSVRAADGTLHVWQFTSVVDDEQGTPYVLCHALDVTESKRHERQLRDWSIRDPLTGCHNRRYLAEVSAGLLPDESWGCIAVDLDHFKQVNDQFGHERGDEVLVNVGKFLRAHVRPADIVVRAGGDEFLILLKDADEAQTQTICDRMLEDREELPVRFSLGFAVRRASEPLANALRVADQRLYEMRAGR